MSQIAPLIATLKRELKAQGMTYRQLAQQLELSESSVKRTLSDQRMTVERLDQVCRILGLEISDLVQKMNEQRNQLEMLTEEQEHEVVADQRLLLMALCVLNGLSMKEILETYDVGEHEAIMLLARLDRLKLIELLPQNRFKVIVASNFQWIPNGPIQRFIRDTVLPHFLKSSFSHSGEKLMFRSGMLSRVSNERIIKKMERLIAEFSELSDEDRVLPSQERFGTSILLSVRPWEFEIFKDLRKIEEKVF